MLVHEDVLSGHGDCLSLLFQAGDTSSVQKPAGGDGQKSTVFYILQLPDQLWQDTRWKRVVQDTCSPCHMGSIRAYITLGSGLNYWTSPLLGFPKTRGWCMTPLSHFPEVGLVVGNFGFSAYYLTMFNADQVTAHSLDIREAFGIAPRPINHHFDQISSPCHIYLVKKETKTIFPNF